MRYAVSPLRAPAIIGERSREDYQVSANAGRRRYATADVGSRGPISVALSLALARSH